MYRRAVLPIMAVAFGLAAQQAPPQESAIVVSVEGLRSGKGQVLCALFSSAADFPSKIAKSTARIRS